MSDGFTPDDGFTEDDPVPVSELAAAHAPFAAPKPADDSVSTSVRRFFDPSYGKPPTQQGDLGDVVKQGVKGASFLVGGPALGGALFSAGSTDWSKPGDALMETAAGAVGGHYVGKVVKQVGSLGGAAVNRIRSALSDAAPGAGVAERTIVPPASPAVPVTQRIAQTIAGESTPTEAARLLQSKGVRLTRGMQDPASPANQLEQALQSTHPYGPQIARQRATASQDFRVAAANEARPPGMGKIEIGTDLGDAVGALKEGFDTSYRSVGSHPLYPAVHGPGGGPLQGVGSSPGLASQAVASVRRLSDSQRSAISADIEDLLTKLPERKGAVGQVDASDLIELRSIVRSRGSEWAATHTPEGSAAHEAYEAVEDQITAALETQLPSEAAVLLRKTDAAYRNFKVLDSAMQSARGSGGEFTTRQLAMAASKGSRGIHSATGDLGPMYDLAVAGNRVLASTVKPTGERVAILQSAGHFMPEWATKRVAGSAVTSANRAAMSPAVAAPAPVASSLPGSGVPGAVASKLALDGAGKLKLLRAAATQAPDRTPGEEDQPQPGGAPAPSIASAHSTPVDQVMAIRERLSADPRTAPYAQLLQRATQEGGPSAAASLHFRLYERDPEYRRAATGAGGE